MCYLTDFPTDLAVIRFFFTKDPAFNQYLVKLNSLPNG